MTDEKTPLERDLAKRSYVTFGWRHVAEDDEGARSFSGPVSACARHHARCVEVNSRWEAMLRECAERGDGGWGGDGGMASPEEVGRRLGEEGEGIAVIYWPE